MKKYLELETERKALQSQLENECLKEDRNRKGQYATPFALASDIVKSCLKMQLSKQIRFLDPGFGTGAFYSALLSSVHKENLIEAKGFEIDPFFYTPTKKLWRDTPLDLEICDFTKKSPPKAHSNRYNLLICNPPYVRHQHLDFETKLFLKSHIKSTCGIDFSGLAGLYCFYLCLCHEWMEDNALASWLIPTEFMDVNYGKSLKEYLTEKVSLKRIHRFQAENVQFADALVSSAVLFFEKSLPTNDMSVDITFGPSLLDPDSRISISLEELRKRPKWTQVSLSNGGKHLKKSNCPKLGDFFTIKRGLATGSNSFFIISEEKAAGLGILSKYLRPILPPPRNLESDVVECDNNGYPKLTHRLFLIDTSEEEETIKKACPALWNYLQEGKREGIHEKYLCAHRKPWYSQENRPSSMYLCSYMGRQTNGAEHPFRFILNHSNARATNGYLIMYPDTLFLSGIQNDRKLAERVWLGLNEITREQVLEQSRVYGGGLRKLEPRELAAVSAERIAKLL